METILIEVIKFLGGSAASGFTWDVMKQAGNGLLGKFKRHFAESKFFNDENQAEDFLKDISSKESLNKRHPLEDIWSIYDNCTGSEASDLFKKEFVDWIRTNQEEFDRLGENIGSKNGIVIEKQVNKGKAQVTNIGNQYNYGGAADNGKHAD